MKVSQREYRSHFFKGQENIGNLAFAARKHPQMRHRLNSFLQCSHFSQMAMRSLYLSCIFWITSSFYSELSFQLPLLTICPPFSGSTSPKEVCDSHPTMLRWLATGLLDVGARIIECIYLAV
jgi:hypothetical protein